MLHSAPLLSSRARFLPTHSLSCHRLMPPSSGFAPRSEFAPDPGKRALEPPNSPAARCHGSHQSSRQRSREMHPAGNRFSANFGAERLDARTVALTRGAASPVSAQPSRACASSSSAFTGKMRPTLVPGVCSARSSASSVTMGLFGLGWPELAVRPPHSTPAHSTPQLLTTSQRARPTACNKPSAASERHCRPRRRRGR